MLRTGFISQYLLRFSHSRHALLWLLLLAFVLHLGNINAFFYCDDFIHYAYFLGSEKLQHLGLLPEQSKLQDETFAIFNQFNFFSKATGTYQSLYDYGAIPWWTSEEAKLHLFRPLSSINHWLDYQLWPESPALMLLHNLIIYLIFLSISFKLYTLAGTSRTVAVLALLFLMVDYSSYTIISWVAARNTLINACYGLLCLYFYHRSIDTKPYIIISLFLYLCAILSAEGGIAIAGYLGAYFLVYDRRSWKSRILHITPFIIITLIWQAWYIQSGYGSEAIGQYIQPSTSLSSFLSHAIRYFPLAWVSLFSNIDLFEIIVPQDFLPIVQKVSAVLAAFFIIALWPLRGRSEVRFCLLAVTFSIIPGLSLASSEPRGLFLPSVAACCLMAEITRSVFTGAFKSTDLSMVNIAQKLLIKSTGYYFLIACFLLSSLITIGLSIYYFIAGEKIQKDYEPLYNYPDTVNIAGKHLIIVNSPSPFLNMYYPFHANYLKHDIALSTRILAPAFTQMTLKRTGVKSFQLQSQSAFILSRESSSEDIAKLQAFHTAAIGNKMLGFFRNSNYDFQEQRTYSFDELSILIIKTHSQRPEIIGINLSKQDLNTYRWIYWDWNDFTYKPLPELNIGESFTLSAPKPF